MSEMMHHKACVEYVMMAKLQTHHETESGVWTISGDRQCGVCSVMAPEYDDAVNQWKALYGDLLRKNAPTPPREG